MRAVLSWIACTARSACGERSNLDVAAVIRLDDHYDEHPKIAGLTDEAFRFWHRGLAWAVRNLSDGFVPTGVARQLAGNHTKKLTDELIAARLWEVRDGGWNIHDILDWNWSKDEALAHRATTRDERVRAGQARARGPRGKDGRLTSGTSGDSSEGTSSGTSGAASEITSASPAHSQAQYPVPIKLASPSLREVPERDEERLDRAFATLGCVDNALKERLLADDAVAVIVEKVERLAETPGKPGASPTSRITNYLKACEDTLEEQRERVREDRDQRARIEAREREWRERREAEARIEAEGSIAPDHIVTLQQSLSRHLAWEPKDRKRLSASITADADACLDVARRLDEMTPHFNTQQAIEMLHSLGFETFRGRVG